MHTLKSAANGTEKCINIHTTLCTSLYATLYSTSAPLSLKDSHTVIILCEMIAWKDAIASFQWLLRFPAKGIIRYSTACRLALRFPTYRECLVEWQIFLTLCLVVAYKSECYLKDTRHIRFLSNFSLGRWNSSIFHGICIPPLTHRPFPHSPKWDLS